MSLPPMPLKCGCTFRMLVIVSCGRSLPSACICLGYFFKVIIKKNKAGMIKITLEKDPIKQCSGQCVCRVNSAQ